MPAHSDGRSCRPFLKALLALAADRRESADSVASPFGKGGVRGILRRLPRPEPERPFDRLIRGIDPVEQVMAGTGT